MSQLIGQYMSVFRIGWNARTNCADKSQSLDSCAIELAEILHSCTGQLETTKPIIFATFLGTYIDICKARSTRAAIRGGVQSV